MTILLDHCVDWRLARSLTAHEVRTAGELGWNRLRNGDLLAAAAAAQFDLLLTTDQNIRQQQNLSKLPIAVVVMVVRSNRLSDLLPLIPAVEGGIRSLQPLTLIEVALPAP